MEDLLNAAWRNCVKDSGSPVEELMSTNVYKKETRMNISRIMLRSLLVIGLGACCLMPFVHARAAADASVPVPAIIQQGFSLWAKNRQASWAFDTWKIGGLMERDNKPNTLSR